MGLKRLLALAMGLLCASAFACAQERAPDSTTVAIDLDHILRGGINRRGELVGLHHQPSAPESMPVDGKSCEVWFMYTSEGGPNDVRTARVELREPKSGRVVLQKFSTLFPKSWTSKQVEAAIREAYKDALARDGIDRNGRWEGRTAGGVRIDGFMSADGKSIATAFPVYVRPRGERRRS